jgi:hypothetical protein
VYPLNHLLRSSVAAGCTLLMLMAATVSAQPYTYIWDGGSGVANNYWDLGPNWNIGTSGQANNVVPYAYYQEMGEIGLVGGNPVVVNVRTLQDTLGTSGGSHPANRRAVAGVTVQDGSTLNIQSTGKLVVLTTFGTNGATTGIPTPGTGDATLNTGGIITVQSAGQLTVSDTIQLNEGMLNVLPGGVVNTKHVDSAFAGQVALSGNASLTSSGSTTLGGTTTITGPNAVFNTGQLIMTDSTVFTPVVTGASHSIIDVNGPVAINGTIRPQFQGVAPVLGDTWVIWDSTATSGTFDFFDDQLTDLPDGHRYNVATTTAGSVHGTRGLLTVENFITAEVNRATGQVTLRNTAATGGVTIEGYQITSAAGTLVAGNFTSSLHDDDFDGGEWVESSLTANAVGELNPTSNSLIATSSSNPLGSIYDPLPLLQQFGDPVPQDLVFTYRQSDGRVVPGAVTYVDDGVANTFVLQIDPDDGKARIINDSPFDSVSFDSYRILSDSMSLNTNWSSLEDQTIGDWVEGASTANALSELNPFGSLTVDSGATAAVLENVYDFASGTPDLAFEFRVPGTGVLSGVVRYSAFSTVLLIGDYNEDNVVNAADYTVWRNHLGAAGDTLPNRDPDNGSGPISSADYASWKSNFGATPGSGAGAAGASAVPEPSTLALAVIFICGILGTRCRVCFVAKQQLLCLVPLV